MAGALHALCDDDDAPALERSLDVYRKALAARGVGNGSWCLTSLSRERLFS